MKELTMSSTIEFYNGVEIPILGYSTEEHEYNRKTQREIFENAIEVGYRYFDTSELDYCLRPLGDAVRKSGIPREKFFIAVKMSTNRIRLRRPVEDLNEFIDNLGLDYIDLYSLTWPYYETFKTVWCGVDDRVKTNCSYKGMQHILKERPVRAIGVCNFEIHHLQELMNFDGYFKFDTMPMINQSHFHPQYTCEELREFCKKNHIVFGGLFEKDQTVKQTKRIIQPDVKQSGLLFEVDDEAKRANFAIKRNMQRRRRDILVDGYEENPFKEENNPRRERFYYDTFDLISDIGKKYNKTNQQIVNRWSLQHNVVTLVKTIWRKSMEEQADIFDFELTEQEMDMIDSLNIKNRIGYNPDYIDF